MKKKLAILLALIIGLMCILTGCGEEKIDPQTVKIAALSGPTGMGMAPMMVDKPTLADGVDLDFTLATSADQITADIINGTYQIAAVPTNLAATLYNKTNGKVILGAVNTLGTLSIVSDSSLNINSLADLKGQTIGATGQGAVPEYVLKSLLTANGINPDTDVTIQWYGEHAEAAAALASGEIQIAMLPQPFATTTLAQNSNLTASIDLNQAWSDANNGQQMEMGCIVVNKEWADNNPALVKKFMEAYKASIETINSDSDEAAQYVADAGIIPKKELAKKAIPNCAITFISAQDSKKDLNGFLTTLYNYNPASVGGSVPAEDSSFFSLTY
ncbi:MAG: ABC transporter substrate-binding protein [Eubacteriaceae bacterium]